METPAFFKMDEMRDDIVYCLETIHHLGPQVDYRTDQGLDFKNILKILMLLLVRSAGSTNEYSQRVQDQLRVCQQFIRECRRKLTELCLIKSRQQDNQHKRLQRLNPRLEDSSVTMVSSIAFEWNEQPRSRFSQNKKPIPFSVYDIYKEFGDESTLRSEDLEESLECLLLNFPTETQLSAAEPVNEFLNSSTRPSGPVTSAKSVLNQASWTRLTDLATAIQQVKPCTWFIISFCVIVFLGSVLSIWWTIWKSDISGGFTMGAFITGAGCGTINKLHSRHRDDGRCQCTQPSLEDGLELDTIDLQYDEAEAFFAKVDLENEITEPVEWEEPWFKELDRISERSASQRSDSVETELTAHTDRAIFSARTHKERGGSFESLREFKTQL